MACKIDILLQRIPIEYFQVKNRPSSYYLIQSTTAVILGILIAR